MASNRLRRIAKELSDIQADTDSKIFAEPANGSDLSHLLASFPGPPDTPYEGGTYIVDIKIPNEYPFRPPVMFFKTKLWHPNVSSQTVRISLLPVLLGLTYGRVLSASIHWAQPGPQFSQSNPPSSRSNLSLAHPNPKTLKTQK